MKRQTRQTRHCPKCHKTKPATAFRNVDRWCKLCKRADDATPAEMQRYNVAALKKRILQSASRRAEQLGLEFDINLHDFNIPKNCPLLGIELDLGNISQSDASLALDRIDPSKGYIEGNVHVVSHRANRLKSDATLDELALLVYNLRSILN